MVSLSITLLLVIAIILLFKYKIHEDLEVYKGLPLYNQQEVDEVLACFYKHHENWNDENTLRVKIGFYLQNITFVSLIEINANGYFWIKYPNEYKETLWKHLDSQQEKVIFPEEVNAGISTPAVAMGEPKVIGDEVVELYYFDKVVVQSFNFTKFPFDFSRKNPFWLKVWPNVFGKENNKHIILVPDFTSYEVGKDKIFGMGTELVTPLDIIATFYDMETEYYPSSFGQEQYSQSRAFPILYYNVVFKRPFKRAFVEHFLPIIVILMVLFFNLLIIRDTKDSKFNLLNFAGVSSGCTLLVLSIIISHQAILEKFAGSGTIYIESLVILLYLVSIAVIFVALRFAISDREKFSLIVFDNALLPRVLYWPIIFTTILVLSWVMLLGEDQNTFNITEQTTNQTTTSKCVGSNS